VTDSSAVFVALSESKLDVVSADDVMEIFGPRFDGFAYLPAVGTPGGILVAWHSDKIVASNFSYCEHDLFGDFSLYRGQVVVYGRLWAMD
jgi:hypothetical protein